MGRERPCGACGKKVEPLRAGSVLLFDDGFRYLCGEPCRKRYLAGERFHEPVRPPAPPADRSPHSSPTVAVRSDLAHAEERPAAVPFPLSLPMLDRTGWVGASSVLLASFFGFFGGSFPMALISAFFSCVAAGAALWASWSAVRDVGYLAWALGPLGAVGAAIAAANSVLDGGGSWLALEGAALAAAAMVARAWFDAEAARPVEDAVRVLLERMPGTVRVPSGRDAMPSAVSLEVVPTDKVRTGEDVVAIEGDTMGVDGVVQAGEALALPYPGANTPVRRVAGDALLAGSRIVEGAVRVVASRVGENRGLVRIARFGSSTGREAAPIARIAGVVTRWGGLGTIGLASVVFALAETGGLSAPLSAASAVLLAAPLLAVRRAAESPLLAAAANAGARGIVFQNALALDLAGRVAVVALSPYGTLTEGKPEVLEVLSVQGDPVDPLVALAAAAEQSAVGTPIADAIRRYAGSNNIEPASVRRATHLPGRGVTALAPGGDEFVIGNRKLLLDQGVSVAAADGAAAAAEASGRTALFAALGGRVRALFTLQDSLRPGARAAVQRMLDLNQEVVLLTGDQRRTVERLAAGLDITHIKAELLPEERGREVSLLRDTGGKVAAVGHPRDDHAALSAAHVGIALGAAGSAEGERAIALVTRDVRDAAAALWIARAARERALRATSVAAGAFAIIVAAAAAGLIVPGIAAILAVGVDAHAVRAGARLLRRIELRLPART